MAIVEVSTWAELASALRATYSEATTIKLTKGIDCNNEIPTGVSSTVVIPRADYTLTIDGSYEENGVIKNYEIRNLRTVGSNPVAIFQLNGASSSDTYRRIYFRNIDFVNLILDAPLAEGYFGNSADYPSYAPYNYYYFVNCRFTGKRTTYMFTKGNMAISHRFYLQSCFVNMPYYGTSKEAHSLVRRTNGSYTTNHCQCFADFCWIRTAYIGTYTPSYDSGNVYSDLYNVNLNGCRIEGEIVGIDSNTTNLNIHTMGAASSDRTATVQNVYDVDFYMMNVIGNKNVDFSAYKGVVKRPVKQWEDKTTTYDTYNTVTGLIFATESQMQDAQWLLDNNFDIVVSNQGG